MCDVEAIFTVSKHASQLAWLIQSSCASIVRSPLSPVFFFFCMNLDRWLFWFGVISKVKYW